MYLTGVGFPMVLAGIQISDINDANVPGVDPPDYTNLLFAGGFLTTVFWVWNLM